MTMDRSSEKHCNSGLLGAQEAQQLAKSDTSYTSPYNALGDSAPLQSRRQSMVTSNSAAIIDVGKFHILPASEMHSQASPRRLEARSLSMKSTDVGSTKGLSYN